MTANPTPVNARPLLDLQGLFAAVRRRWRHWLSIGLLGLLLGGVAAFLLPPTPTAVTRLLVVHENDSPADGGSLMETDIAVLETTRIAALTLDRLGPGTVESPTDLMDSYEATGLTSNVMELSVQGPTDEAAVARAKALAATFIADHRGRARAAADANARAFQDQQRQAQRELREVDALIVESTDALGNPAGSPAELESLYARRAELENKVSDFGTRAEEAGIGMPWVIDGTQVVDAPHLVPISTGGTLLTYAGLGLALGLVGGIGLAAVSSVVRDRAVFRRDISEHLGASVVAQVTSASRGPSRWWRRSGAVAERAQVAVTLARLVGRNSPRVSMLELGCAQTAADLADGVAHELGGTRSPSPGPRPGSSEVRVGSVAPGTAWTDLRALGSETILVVRAGHAENAWLHTVARQLADAEIPIIGVVLVDPDPADRTDGTLWDGLHTALRGRAHRFEPAWPPSNGDSNNGDSNKGNGKTVAPLIRDSRD